MGAYHYHQDCAKNTNSWATHSCSVLSQVFQTREIDDTLLLQQAVQGKYEVVNMHDLVFV
jgi:hypothetical protein